MGSLKPLNRFARWLLPRHQYEVGPWRPYLWLIYLIFLFLPFTVLPRGQLGWLWPTLVSLPVFLVVYVWQLHIRRPTFTGIVLIALLSYLLTPVNQAAFTYLTYACIFAPFAVRGLPRALLITFGLLAVQAAEIHFLHQSPLNLAVAVLICIVSCIASYFGLETWRKSAALRLSQAEVRRIAAVAERERIGRDLHDLLGHTLSLIALKSELAGRLLDRDRQAAAVQIADVTRVARDALRQVRTAVTGIRSAALAAELESARALLKSAGVELVCRRDDIALPVETETALAMIVREAVTNIQRHADAAHVRVEVTTGAQPQADAASAGGVVRVLIADDGRGGASVRGNGLAGMAERLQSLGGTLQIESPRGGGTELRASLPFRPYLAGGVQVGAGGAGASDAAVTTVGSLMVSG
jgi:two-component system sensor histidine kinase DesK